MLIDQAFRLALQHHQAGRFADAEGLYRQILVQDPNHPDATYLFGVLSGQLGRYQTAVDLIRKAMTLRPATAELYNNLSEFCRRSGKPDEAIAAGRQAIALEPDYAEAYSNLGNALQDNGLMDEALGAYHHSIALKANLPEAHNNLGNALRAKGQLDAAVAAYRQAVSLRNNYPEAQYNLGNALFEQGLVDEAVAAYQRALALNPRLAEAHNNLGHAWRLKGLLDEAIVACRQAIALRPGYAEALVNLGNALLSKGHLDEAMAVYGQAIALRPHDAVLESRILFAGYYDENADASSILQKSLQWNVRHAEPLRHLIRPHTNMRDPDRPLRIGYVSPDFRGHSVAFFLLPLLEHHDRSRFRITAYYNHPISDPITRRIQSSVDQWHGIFGTSDAWAAELIRQDGIDILVDLAGHSALNRLLLFALKPAPIQLTWLGYPGTTGLSAMDYRLTDALADPPGVTERFSCEKVLRLPTTAWCFSSLWGDPPITPPPALKNGYITFGTFNNFAKVNRGVLELWSQILLQVPNSHLLLKNSAMSSGQTTAQLRDFFAARQIAPERLEFLRHEPDALDHLCAYERMDIALDTFPYDGTTTTCEALWMGVPVIALAGKTHASRVGVSLLTNAGLPELATNSVQEYVGLAVRLANDLPRLVALRSGLRSQMQASPLIDARQFAADMEAVYRQIWQQWCIGRQT